MIAAAELETIATLSAASFLTSLLAAAIGIGGITFFACKMIADTALQGGRLMQVVLGVVAVAALVRIVWIYRRQQAHGAASRFADSN